MLAPREIVKKGTSSKKSDTAPAKADPARAKNKKKVGGNEGALKTKLDNKSVSAPATTASKHYKKPLDRHSRSTKKDSGKKVSQGWGSIDGKANLEDEVDAEDDATDALEVSDKEVVDEIPKRSLNEYFEELRLQQASLDGNKAVRAANEGNEDKWTSEERIVRQEEENVTLSLKKKAKSKNHKEKKFLDFEATFADEIPESDSTRARGSFRGSRGTTRGARGSTRGSRGSRGSARGARGSSTVVDVSSKPSESSKVNLADDKKFPSL